MRPEAANLDADTHRAIKHNEEWFAKHGREPQSPGFFDAGYEDERPGSDPLQRLLRKYANYADAIDAFLAIKPLSGPLPEELVGKTTTKIYDEWNARRRQVRAWEELEKAQSLYFAELESPENLVEPVGDGTLYTTFKYPQRVARYRRAFSRARRLYEKVDGVQVLPLVRAEWEADQARRRIAEAEGDAVKSAREEEWNRKLDDQKAQESFARWEAVIVMREPVRAIREALGPGRIDYDAAARAFSDWEAGWFGPSGRALIVPNHPDPRNRASWEIRQWLLPLRYAYEDPKYFFREIAPRLDPDDFDPSKIAPSPFHATYLARTLRNWGFGVLLNPGVRAAYDLAARKPHAFGEALAIAERKTGFPKDGSRKGHPKKRATKTTEIRSRMEHWKGIFASRNRLGRRRLLTENGIDPSSVGRLPTIEGCALRVCARELTISLDAARKLWGRSNSGREK